MLRSSIWTPVLASLAYAGDAPLREDWAAKDVEAARRVAGALAETKLPKFLEKLGSVSSEEDRDIGFGARRLRLSVYGGYTTTWVTVVSFDGGVGPIEVDCHEGDAEVWTGLRGRIRLVPNRAFTAELSVAGPVAEWGGRELRLALEQVMV